MLAPIVLFVFNRLDHVSQAIKSLQENDLSGESDLIIFSDGYKDKINENKIKIIRKYLQTIAGFKNVQIIERSENFGLAKSIISGVTEVVEKYGKVIVLEDDLLVSPYFLKYMNTALDMYENEDKVISIHGYIYPVKEKLPETFFLRGADCWGWATWKRGWKLFEIDGKKLLVELKEKELTKKFDMDGVYPFVQMLEGQIKGFNNSWAVRWYASAFLKNKLTLYPGRSLVSNIGFDGSGTHTGKNTDFRVLNYNQNVEVKFIPFEENGHALECIKKYFSSPKLRLMILLMRFKFILRNINNKYVK